MSQLNLKQILSGDNLSVVVDKLNYNFNQIVLNGGGPQGLRGLLGAPGLPGAQGLQGPVGPIGETGTHIYADGASPGIYPFGTGGEILPRVGDIFIETDPTYLIVWELAATGASSSYWNFVEKIEAPGSGLSKLVYDQTYGPIAGTGASSTWTAVSNDPTIAGKLLIGSPQALYGNYLIDPLNPIGSGTSRFRAEFSAPVPFSESLVTLASAGYQLRILDSTRPFANIITSEGGVIHNLQTVAGRSMYYIQHGDSVGDKHFVLKLSQNTSSPNLLYGDTANRLAIGLSDSTPLVSQLTVNSTFAVGSPVTGFYLGASGASFSGIGGGIIEGNVSIGRNRNNYATLGIYNRPSQFGASLRIDTDITPASPNAVADLFLGGSMYAKDVTPTTPSNFWRIRHDSNSAGADYRKLSFFTTQQGLTGGTGTGVLNVFAMGVTASGNFVFPQLSIGTTTLTDSFTVNTGFNTVAIGLQQGGPASGYMSTHISMGMSRNVLGNWTRFGDSSNNAGRTLWASTFSGLGISLFGSTGGSDVGNITDTQVYDNTRAYFGVPGSPGWWGGNLVLSETRSAANYGWLPGIAVDSGATGTTSSGLQGGVFRRYVGFFGDGPFAIPNKSGTPIIATTNGITQSLSTGHGVKYVPHYTWWGNDQSGLFLSNGSTANGAFGNAVGLLTDGQAGLYVGNQRIGIFQTDPLDIFQIGNKLVYHNGGYKSINYNLYYNTIAGADYRIEGSTASGQFQQGAFKIGFGERNRVDGVAGETAYRNFGTSLNLEPHGMGGVQTSLSSPVSGRIFRGMKICPPPVGPTASGWSNQAPNVPQVMIGLTDEEAINSFVGGRRGTLSIASQFRIKPATSASPPTGPFGITIEDQYNIGLYNFEGYPVSGIYSGGGNYGSSTVKTFGINFLGEGGNTIAGDVPFLYATTDATLSRAYQRTANFGINFRVGINAVPPVQPSVYTSPSDPIYNLAGLIVGGYAESIPGGSEQAIISKGILTIDQSTFSFGSGGNQGLVIKDNTITTTYGTTRFSTSEYFGDWALQYTKANASEAGLNFWKPSGSIGGAAGSNGILYLSDNGNISVGFDPYSATGIWSITSLSNINSILTLGYERLNPSAPNAGDWRGQETTGTYTAKISINGFSKQQGIFNTSDQRLKTEIGRPVAGSMLSKILNLKPVLYSWKEEYSPMLKEKIELGFFAQEVEEFIPEAVHKSSTANFEDERTLEYNAVFTASVGAIQDLHKLIQEKDEKIKNLEDKLSKIEALLSKNGIK